MWIHFLRNAEELFRKSVFNSTRVKPGKINNCPVLLSFLFSDTSSNTEKPATASSGEFLLLCLLLYFLRSSHQIGYPSRFGPFLNCAQQNWVFSENSRKELISFRIILNMTGQFWLLVSSLRLSKSPVRLAHLSSTLKKVVSKFSSLFVVFTCLGFIRMGPRNSRDSFPAG